MGFLYPNLEVVLTFTLTLHIHPNFTLSWDTSPQPSTGIKLYSTDAISPLTKMSRNLQLEEPSYLV